MNPSLHRRRVPIGLASASLVVIAACGPPPPDPPDGSIERVTENLGGEGGGQAYAPTSISGDGSRVAFWSTAWDLVPDDPNAVADVYVWDAPTDATVRVTNSRSYYDSAAPVISDDGRFVAFSSAAWDLAPGGLNGVDDAFVWDAADGGTTRVGEGEGSALGISGDGGRVLFAAGVSHLSVWDAATATRTRIADGYVTYASISGDGRWVVYAKESSDLPGDTNGVEDVFLWDAETGTTVRITDGDGASTYPDISDDGRHVAFLSSASDLVPGGDSEPGVFVWDATTGATTRATGPGIPRISGDGGAIALSSRASDLVPGDTNGVEDLFLWDAATGTTVRLTDGNGHSGAPAISADGDSIAFLSDATNLVADDRNAQLDVFVWRRGA